MEPSNAELKKEWGQLAAQLLVGKTIKKVTYMTAKEQDSFMWNQSAVVIELNDGTLLWPSADDEGNDAGALFTTNKNLPVIPVI